MNDTNLLEETIRMTLLPYPEGLQDYKVENYVVATIGRRGDPVEMDAYDSALASLFKKRIIDRTKVPGAGYAFGQKVEESGYKLLR